ncbi:MAG: hypothetical protein KF819_29385 [Labilithrix sp.]|nr:hypothetical protein [Labilithrix sp.]
MVRRRARVFAGLVSIVVAASSAAACILPDFTVVAADVPDTGGSEGGGGDAGPSDDATAQPDGALVCPANTGDCDRNPANGCETDLLVTTAHCGVCDRSCAGAACENGDCKVERLVSALKQPFGLEVAGPRLVWHESESISGCRTADCMASKAILVDINGSLASMPTGTLSPRQIAVEGGRFYYADCLPAANADCGVSSCDIAGCKFTGGTAVVPFNGNRRAMVLVSGVGGIFTHHGLDGLIRTALPSGPTSGENLKYGIGDQLQAFYSGATHVVWLDDNASQANPIGGVFVVAPAGGAATRILPPPVKHLAVDSAVAFTSTGGAAANAASIVGCEVAGCSSAGTILAGNQPYVSDIAADATAVYWSVVGAADPRTNTTPVGAVMRCARPACAGGPTRIADGLLNPVSVRIDATHVYWLERGAPAMPTGAVSRKRR